MKSYGFSSLSEFLGDNVIFRNLNPVNNELPSLAELRDSLGVDENMTPRKSTKIYAQVVKQIIMKAQENRGFSKPIIRLIYLGDTRMNDSIAFKNICEAGGWNGKAFICNETTSPPFLKINKQNNHQLFLSNRWRGLKEFENTLVDQKYFIDQQTVLLIDIDKTAIGARGRNDAVINQTRLEAAFKTMKFLLGDDFKKSRFEEAYIQFNSSIFHPFTQDNQDFLVYMCLMISADLVDKDALKNMISESELSTFQEFLKFIEQQKSKLTEEVQDIHDEIISLVKQGDNTPFKLFRRNEYLATVERMNTKRKGLEPEIALMQNIVLTYEVRQFALRCKGNGALLFGLSDKPDEASLPTPELERDGYQPLHRVQAYVIGA